MFTDILMGVAFTQETWPRPYMNEIPGLLIKDAFTDLLAEVYTTLLKQIKGTCWYRDLYWTLSLKEVPGLCQTHCN